MTQTVKNTKKTNLGISGKLLWFFGVSVVLSLLLAGSGMWYRMYQKKTAHTSLFTPTASVTPVVTTSPSRTLPPLPSQMPVLDIPSNWNTFTNYSKNFTFRYPSNWYSLKNPSYPDTDVSFFIQGITADFGFGDHSGNEVLAIEFADDSSSLEELKDSYFPNAEYVNISGKYALKTNISNPLYIIKVSGSKQLSIMYFNAAEKYIDQIVSSFHFVR